MRIIQKLDVIRYLLPSCTAAADPEAAKIQLGGQPEANSSERDEPKFSKPSLADKHE